MPHSYPMQRVRTVANNVAGSLRNALITWENEVGSAERKLWRNQVFQHRLNAAYQILTLAMDEPEINEETGTPTTKTISAASKRTMARIDALLETVQAGEGAP